MNKRGLLIGALIISVFMLSFVSAANETQNYSQLDKAYNCIQNKISDDCSKLTADEMASSILTLGSYKNCVDSFLAKSTDGKCWPIGNCKVKETSIALLAMERAGKNTDKIKNWLLNQTKVASDLTWYLQIESSTATTCQISYNNQKFTTNINEDKTFATGAGSCLSISENGYWLRIASTCVEKDYSYTISCNKDFSTTALYKSSDSDTIHVSQNINSAVSGGESVEQVTYKCFKTGTACDYEGSLWAVVALTKLSIDTSEYLPYLDTLLEEKVNLFPEAFLYAVTDLDTYLKAVVETNFKGNFWKVGDYTKEYSTSLAFLALQSKSSEQMDAAKTYLLNGKNQNSDGCWNNIRDTGLLLYFGWPIINKGSSDECSVNSDCGSNEECLHNICVDKINLKSCEQLDHYCVLKSECVSPAVKLTNFECFSIGDVCCSENFVLPTCASKQGLICNSNEECSGDVEASSDGSCCLAECNERAIVTQNYTCVGSSVKCQSVCNNGETQLSLTCSGSKVCCESATSPSIWSSWWIWVLLILIILAIVGIIFKDKIRTIIFKSKNNFKKGPGPRETRPPFSPPSPRPMFPVQRPMMQRPVQRPMPAQKSSKDKEFEETLKKLKEMSK
ncbi:MAG: hypothetical protein WC781_04345 [Candidatus Pacearchaeota archaeon]|jgi:hypothetical protein